MNSAGTQSPLFHIGDWVTFHYGPKKVSAKVVEDRGTLGVNGRRLYRVQLDEEPGEAFAFEMPENELETAATPVRQSYHVEYTRQEKTNVWRAITRGDGLHRGVKSKGVVGYISTGIEGGTSDALRHVIVTVMLEVAALSTETGVADNPDVRRELAERARGLADELFISRHPRARIEHAPSAN
jgi:hypothetical protein